MNIYIFICRYIYRPQRLGPAAASRGTTLGTFQISHRFDLRHDKAISKPRLRKTAVHRGRGTMRAENAQETPAQSHIYHQVY